MSPTPTITQLSIWLNSKVTLAHARESLTPDEIKALWELQANLMAALPPTKWMSNYITANGEGR